MVIGDDAALSIPDDPGASTASFFDHMYDTRLNAMNNLHQRVRIRVGQQRRYCRRKESFLCHVVPDLPLFALPYGYLQSLERVATNDFDGNCFTNAIGGEHRLEILSIVDRFSVKSNQDVAKHQAALLGRTVIV